MRAWIRKHHRPDAEQNNSIQQMTNKIGKLDFACAVITAHLQIVSQDNPVDGARQAPKEVLKVLRDQLRLSNVVSQPHFNRSVHVRSCPITTLCSRLFYSLLNCLNSSLSGRINGRAVRDGNFKLRTTPDTTGVCNVCSELKATMKNSRLPAVERIQASRDKIAHDAEVRVCMLPTT